MSETLRDLVVSLSLNSDNFSRNIRSVTAQIREAESTFKLAGAGVTGFEKTTAGLTSKLGMLESKLGLQQSAVAQYERALDAANGKLKESVANNDKIKTALEQAKAKYADLGGQITVAKANYDAWNTAVGEGHAKTIAAKSALDALEKEYAETGAEIKKLEGQLIATQKAMQNNADKVSQAQTNLNNARAALKDIETQIKSTSAALATAGSKWTAAGTAFTSFSKSAEKVAKVSKTIGRDLTRYLTTPIVGLGAYALKTSIDIEEAFAGVRKTVDMTESEFAGLDKAIQDMTLVKPASYETIAFVAETAGQLGIAKHAIEGFTSVMIDLGAVSTDLSAADAAENLAKLANIMGVIGDAQTDKYFERLGSTVLDLGINSASTEASIVEMAMRLAAAGKQVGLSEAQILGFSTALSSVGIEAQMGGSALSKALIKMEVAAATGGAALTDFAKVCGVTEQEFKTLFKADPAAAFQKFIEGLARMDDEGLSAIATLQDIGFQEVRLRDTTLRLVNATELLSSTQDLAEKAWVENSAITDLVSKRYDTSAKRLEMLKNKARLAANTFSDIMLPAMENIMGGVSKLLDRFMTLEEGERQQIVQFGLMVAAAGPVINLFSKIALGASKVSGMIGKFATAVGTAGGGFKGFASTVLSSKLAVAALSAGLIYGVYKLHDYASGAKAARDALEGMKSTADKWASEQANTVYSNGGLSAFGMDKEDFVAAQQSMKDWRDGLIKIWADGEVETNEIVTEWTDSFKTLTGKTRSALEELRQNAETSEHNGLASTIEADIKALEAMDAEIAALLKKRQGKHFTEQDKIRLDELIDAKEEIEVKYKLTPSDVNGYAQIIDQINVELARAQARGQSQFDPKIYGQALTATAEGYAAITAQVDDWYASEYALINLMDEGEEKQAALGKLNDDYNAKRLSSAEEYAAALKQITDPVWNSEGIKQAETDMDTLVSLFREYSTTGGQDPAILERMNELFEGMDEGDLISYIGLLQQVQSLIDGGMSESDTQTMFPDIDFSTNMDEIAAFATFVKERAGELEGLNTIFTVTIPEEMQKIAVDLDMTAAETRWAQFAANPGVITTEAIISGYTPAENSTVPQPLVDALIGSYAEIEGGASTAQLTPDDVVAQVASYLEAEGADISNLKPDQVSAIVNAYSEATGADKSTLLPALTAVITGYDDTNATMPTIQTKLAITGYDLTAYSAFVEANPIEVTGIVRLGEKMENPEDVLTDQNAKFYLDGQQVEVDVVPREKITADTLFVYDGDGTMHVLITPEIQGTPEAVDEAMTQMQEKAGNVFTGDGLFGSSTLTKMWDAVFKGKEFETAKQGIDLFGLGSGGVLNEAKTLLAGFDESDVAGLTSFVQEIVTAIGNGEEVSQEALDNLQLTIDFINAMDTMGIGQNVTAGIASAMTEAGFTSEASTVASNLESALNSALGIASPSTRMMPIGTNTSAGVGEGMRSYSFAGDGAAVATSAAAAMNGMESSARAIGQRFSQGLANGITSGTSWIRTAARNAALAAKTAAEDALKVSSPSRVGIEIGGYFTKGIALGVGDEQQVRAIRKASQYIATNLTNTAGGAITNDNRRNYNQSNSGNVTVNVDKLGVNDKQDVRALALEIGRLNRRTQFGYGGRA